MINETRQIAQLLTNYSVGKLVGRPIPLRGDTKDVNYKLTTDLGVSYFLKRIRENKSVRFYNFLGSLHERLASLGILVPRVYKNNRGEYVTNHYLLFEFIEGEARVDWTEKEIYSATSGFALLHNELEKVSVPSFIRNRSDLYIKCENMDYGEASVLPTIAASSIEECVKEEIVVTLHMLNKHFGDFQFTKHVIHGDFGEGNALFQDGRLTAIIDLTLRYDSLAYDLGIFIFWTCIMAETNKRLNFMKYRQILETYQNVRRLTSIERRMLPYLILRRSCATFFYSWQRNVEEKNTPVMELDHKLKEIAVWNKGIRSDLQRMFDALNV